MQKSGKRKQPQPQKPPSPSPKSAKTASAEPYPQHRRPTPDECRAVRDDLLALHGFPKEFAIYRSQRLNVLAHTPAKFDPSDGEEDGGPSDRRESVLDGLVGTILSQNTTDSNSRRAFASLKSAFPLGNILGRTLLSQNSTNANSRRAFTSAKSAFPKM
ncbi:DNA glycosylase superfamily protein [Actinidia rufa]|uniref:DNA glycosylase superfamily protein n=1 Tax=Actinidia rufa TaxID=165716 RepID=A0A7J0GMV1_9ERIC|nr:DNA glycosylase superfamily protein [Actinidia rufa]